MMSTKSAELLTSELRESRDAELTEFVDLGEGRYIRRSFRLQSNPRLFFINVFYVASVVFVAVMALLIGFRMGLFLLMFVVGLFSLLRSEVEPKLVRGPLVRDEMVIIEQGDLKSQEKPCS